MFQIYYNLKCLTYNILTFQKQLKVIEYNFRNYTIRWQMSKSKMSPTNFGADFTVSEI